MILNEKFILSNGVEIPKLGLGTWEISNEKAAQAVIDAVNLGYRHIDSAQAYSNENGVGDGVRACQVQREELFITSKLDAAIKSYQGAISSIDASLQRFGLDYLDLMLIHSPKPWMEFHQDERYFEGNREVWRAFEEAYRAGKLRAIGVSNFQKEDIENILDACTVKPMVNQILAHISNTPLELIQYSRAQGMLVEAYSPMAHGELMKNQSVVKMAEKYGVSVPQLSIRYCLQLGLLPLPKTANPLHMKNNAEVEFEIATEDMQILQTIEQIKDYGEFSKFPVFGRKLK
ncbi:aldo/keto reductase [Runella limosa]|uniref:aldo/keto reductase n=1 Tax=Runella limosa TaxID=370978 RepID=UPI0004109CDF|nr:aldo/keto reductase [Runella limosa]